MGGPTPESLAKSGTEHSQQVALFAWAALNVGKWSELKWLHAIPNGGSRGDGTTRGRAIAGGNLKAEGVRSGVSDVSLPVRQALQINDKGETSLFSGVYIEMKKPSGGTVSDEQKEFGAFVKAQGFIFAVVYVWSDAVWIVENYLNGTLDASKF